MIKFFCFGKDSICEYSAGKCNSCPHHDGSGGKNVEVADDSITQLGKEIKTLTGVDIVKDNNILKPIYQILDELTEAYKKIL